MYVFMDFASQSYFFLAMALVYRIVCLEISLVGRRSYTP